MVAEFADIMEHLSNLSRLNLTNEEQEVMAVQLEDVLAAAEKVQELDTQGVEPTSRVSLQQHLREDEVTASLPVEEVLRNSPNAELQMFLVPRLQSQQE